MHVDTASAAKRVGNDLDAKMRFATLTVAGVSLMQMGLVDDIDRVGMKSIG